MIRNRLFSHFFQYVCILYIYVRSEKNSNLKKNELSLDLC